MLYRMPSDQLNHMLKFFMVLTISTVVISCNFNQDTYPLEKLILSNIEECQDYKFPTDSKEYTPENKVPEDFGLFDFIIIGAGSTGTVLANRLSEQREWSILLLETGEYSSDFTDIPSMAPINLHSKYNWGYNSTPQHNSCLGTPSCFVPKGRGVGGSSIISAGIYIRGNPKDYDRWEAMGNKGWTYKDVQKYFTKVENMSYSNNQFVKENSHGNDGLVNVEFVKSNFLTETFFKSLQDFNLKPTDVNSKEQIGYSSAPVTTKRGRKVDGGKAFILPILYRRNLRVLTNAFVTKINMAGKVAKAVTFSNRGRLYKARTRKEIIISAGSINTPQLLMLSGIGPKEQLRKHGVRLVQNLPVGSTLLEHPVYHGLTFTSNLKYPTKSFREHIRDYLCETGLLTKSFGISAVGFYKTNLTAHEGTPDLELLFGEVNCNELHSTSNNLQDYNLNLKGNHCFAIYPIVLHPKSKGSVLLKSKDPFEFPQVDLKLLSDLEQYDSKILLEGIKLGLKLVQTEAFKKIRARLATPPLKPCSLFKFSSEEYWNCTIPYFTHSMFNIVGTCPMGTDPKEEAVVDHNLNVHGVKNLRVADSSVFPSTMSGHPHATCLVIGEKLSDIIKSKYLNNLKT